MNRRLLLFGLGAISLHAQWTLQDSHSTASLRGIHSVGHGVAWASGTKGTVLRTIDAGKTWKTCTVPPGAANLDFRAVQAFDAKTALVMSAGTGELSRVYRTTDGCASWKLVFSNQDREGFWDAMRFADRKFGVLIGDQVGGRFPLFTTSDGGVTWRKAQGVEGADPKQSIFAASNSSLRMRSAKKLFFITGGTTSLFDVELDAGVSSSRPPLASGPTGGGFSIAVRRESKGYVLVAVGGDYKIPDGRAGTAAVATIDANGKIEWRASTTSPGGYRSAVAYDATGKRWIAVGPNGTDESTDDGVTWRSVADTEKNWNALSLPFVVGSNGRIGILSSRR